VAAEALLREQPTHPTHMVHGLQAGRAVRVKQLSEAASSMSSTCPASSGVMLQVAYDCVEEQRCMCLQHDAVCAACLPTDCWCGKNYAGSAAKPLTTRTRHCTCKARKAQHQRSACLSLLTRTLSVSSQRWQARTQDMLLVSACMHSHVDVAHALLQQQLLLAGTRHHDSPAGRTPGR
jgi:hypothetical protein